MKTKEELNALKEEFETLNKKLSELTEEELEEVNGGTGDTSDNPLGLMPGDKVYFYWSDADVWMWGTFLYYFTLGYRVSWNDTRIIYGMTGQSRLISADEATISEKDIRRNAN